MNAAANFLKKVLVQPDLAQISFQVAVLEAYLNKAGVSVKRTETVGRVKTATWSLDFGIAPDEATIHVTLAHLLQKLPESERPHWLQHADQSRFSENFLKMQGSHACIDDGGLRDWGEEESLF